MEIENTLYINKDKSVEYSSYLDHIPVINEEISYNEFFQNYLIKNQACIIKNVAKNWNSYNEWIDKDGNICFDYMLTKYGNLDVTIYNCEEKYYNSQTTDNWKFKDYVNYWRNINNNDKKDLLYLKDWHLKNCIQDDNFYNVPKYFASDMLNEYLCDTEQDDYRFVYMGPKGTWTPFHADVFQSFSWSTNICGKKKWILFPPGAENNMKDKMGNLPYNIDDANYKSPYFELVQNESEAIFVPSGWYHQVYNITDTISINHNWINACNLVDVYESIATKLEHVKKEISDCKEMDTFHEECQLILNATFGMDFKEFFRFLAHISFKRLTFIEENLEEDHKISDILINKNHVIFDLESLLYTLREFLKNENVMFISSLQMDIENLIKRIEFAIKVS